MKGFSHIKTMQGGFSLVELMVAMSIGLFLLLGLSQVFVSSKQSYRLHEGIGRIQENGRFAMEIMGRQIRMAGFRSNPLDVANQPLVAISGQNDLPGDTDTLAGTDSLKLEYWGTSDNRVTDCLGNTVPANNRATVSFQVHPDRELRCSSSVGKQSNKPLLQGINDLQILYGEQVVNPSTSPPTYTYRYLTADEVTDWNSIISLRIEITTDSIESVDPTLPDQGRLERVFSSTFTLRNRL